jgi:hypothetical protein
VKDRLVKTRKSRGLKQKMSVLTFTTRSEPWIGDPTVAVAVDHTVSSVHGSIVD